MSELQNLLMTGLLEDAPEIRRKKTGDPMAKYVTEILKEINENPTLLTTQYRKTGPYATTPEGIILEAAFDPAKRFPLPSGEPPYRPSKKPIGLCESSLSAEVSKFYLYFRDNLSKTKRDLLYIQSLERVSEEEARVLIAVKDQELTKLYPNITPQLVCDAGYISQEVANALGASTPAPAAEVTAPLAPVEDSGTASPEPSEPAGEAPVKRKAGRPKGSKNKPKEAPKN